MVSLCARRTRTLGMCSQGQGRVLARPGRVGENVRAVEADPSIPSGSSKSFLEGKEGGSEERGIVRAFRSWFLNYGLVASILVSTALVALLAYRLEGSRWRWPMAVLALGGIGTAAGILWIRKYIDRQTKTSDQESKQ